MAIDIIKQFVESHDLHPIYRFAVNGKYREVEKFLADGFDPSCENPDGPDLSGIALSREDGGKLLELLIRFGLDIDKPLNRQGQSMLMKAVAHADSDKVKILLDSGASASHSEGVMPPPLFGAVANGDMVTLELLIDASGDLFAKNRNDRTAMHEAATSDQPAMLDFLLTRGLELNTQDNRGSTPLICAAKKGANQSAKWLADNNAKTEITDDKGKTALDWATENGHLEVVALLKKTAD